MKIIIIFFLIVINSFSNNIIIAQEGEIRTIDPHKANDGFSLRTARILHKRLFEHDKDLRVVSGLCDTYKRLNENTVEFKLKDNLYFTNGEDLKIEDIIFSFERMKKFPQIKFILPPIKEIKKIDEKNFQIITKYPFAPLISHLTHPSMSIISKSSKDDNIIGMGPYMFKEWIPGEKVILENPIENKKLIIKTISNPESRSIMLETREVDVTFGLSPMDEKIIEKNKNLKLLRKKSISYTYLGFNMKNKIFQNKNIRLGINYAINKKLLIEGGLNGQGELPKKYLKENLEKSKNLLKNLKDKEFTLAVITGGNDIRIGEIIQGFLKEVGINIKILVLEPGAYWSGINNGKYHMFLGSWASATGDRDYELYPTHHSKNFGIGGNRTFYENKEVDILLEKGRNEFDQKEREKIYEKIDNIIFEDSVEIKLFYKILNGGSQKNIKGLELYPIPIHNYLFLRNQSFDSTRD